MFSSFRELRRLRREGNDLRARISILEKKLETQTELILQRDFLWSDRFLTSKVGTFAIADEANEKTWEKEREKEPDNRAELTAYLESRRRELIEDAREANLPESAADLKFKQLLPQFTAEFHGE